MKRCHTCPIEQVLQEVTSVGPQAREQISRLFCTESQEVAFSESLYDIMKLYSQSVIRVSKELDPEFEDPECLKEHLFFEVWNTCAYTMHSVVHSELDQVLFMHFFLNEMNQFHIFFYIFFYFVQTKIEKLI